jgi:DNA ligase-1
MDSKGKLREWSIRTYVEPDGTPYYEQTHGIVGGKLQETRTHVKQGKNIGKANETSAMEQCNLEAQSLWNKKRDRRGYSEDITESKPVRPMLAKPYDQKKMDFPAYTQPKLDGIRCLAELVDNKVVLKSRQGKVFTALGHIERDVLPVLQAHPYAILDGELYNHTLRDDFQKLVSAIKRDDPSVDSDLIQYHVYDIINKDHGGYVSRKRWLDMHLATSGDSVWQVETGIAGSHECIVAEHQRYTQLGYEGVMVRSQFGEYQIDKRSSYLQKFKEFTDQEFKIVDAFENKGKQAGQCTFICVTEDGAEFGVKPKGTDAERIQYWTDFKAGKLKGKMLTVRFFAWTTSTPPVPRFPVGIAVRDYE